MEQGNGQPAGEGTAENGSANFEMDLYTLQFKWIPSLIDAVVKGNLPCQALADVPWWKKCLKEQGMTKADFSFEEIKAETKKISEEKGRIRLTFPYPKRAPLAKYAVIDLLASGRCILDRKNIETGGQLFGYWTENGTPVILYAIGPGPRANHQVTFFNQDVDYLVKVGNLLRNRYGLHHIGEWHSHHQLGLAKPSGHDSDNMTSVIRRRGLGEFLLCIGNCDNFSSSLNAFLCDSSECRKITWDYVMAVSPLRQVIDYDLCRVICQPQTLKAHHKDLILNQ